MSRIRLVIADDMALLRSPIRQQLACQEELEVVGEAANGQELVDLAARLRPDVIVTDLDMPEMNGLEATRQIAARFPHIKTILLTAHDTLASMGHLAGAVECLNKSCTPEELAAAVRRARTAAPPESLSRNGGPDSAIERLAHRFGLTERERAVVSKVVTTELTFRQIAHALAKEWNERLTESGVKHAMERAMNKLDIEPRTRAALVRFVLEKGE